MPPEIVVGSELPPEIRDEVQREEQEDSKFWRGVAESAISEKVGRLSEGAKQIISINGVLLTAYFAAISLSSLDDQLVVGTPWDWHLILIISPAIMLFIGLVSAAWALEPTSYPLTNNTRLIESLWDKECNFISSRVWWARLFSLLGFGLIVVNIYAYLCIICDP